MLISRAQKWNMIEKNHIFDNEKTTWHNILRDKKWFEALDYILQNDNIDDTQNFPSSIDNNKNIHEKLY